MFSVPCGFCGETYEVMHDDHIVPRSRGGGDEANNCLVSCPGCNLAKSDRLPSEWKPEGLPKLVYELEAILVKKYAMKPRAKRGPRHVPSNREKHNIFCEYYGADLAKDVKRGWVQWWTADNGLEDHKKVFAFQVCCNFRSEGDYEQSCSQILANRMEGWKPKVMQWDHHLSTFVGKNAMWRMQELLWTYEWPQAATDNVTHRMFDFFMAAIRIEP